MKSKVTEHLAQAFWHQRPRPRGYPFMSHTLLFLFLFITSALKPKTNTKGILQDLSHWTRGAVPSVCGRKRERESEREREREREKGACVFGCGTLIFFQDVLASRSA